MRQLHPNNYVTTLFVHHLANFAAMPSHLTRVVFRNIIANEPLLYRGCRYRALRPRVVTQHGARSLPQTQRRTFFGDLFKQRRKLKPAEAPPGLSKMAEVSYAQANSVRPPKPSEVADAIKDFFAQRKGAFEDWHVASAHQAFQYLLENPREDGQPWLNRQDLENVMEKLLDTSKRPEVLGNAHIMFGRLVVDQIAKLMEQQSDKGADEKKKKVEHMGIPLDMYTKWKQIQVLSLFGATAEARDMAVEAFKYDATASSRIRHTILESPARAI